jgi:hypothetical protein
MPQHRSTGTVKRRRRVTYRKTRKTTKKTRRKVQQRRRTRKGTSKVQSILFRKNCYTKKNAINWLKNMVINIIKLMKLLIFIELDNSRQEKIKNIEH